jgi:IS5 family transposase
MGCVQGRSKSQRELLDAESVSGHLLPAGSVFGFLAEHRRELFPDELFADLFGSGRGRPSVPADVVATVLVLQALHGLSDREAAEAVTFDLRWKAACGLPVTAAAFHPTVLTYWRRRLAASDRPQRIFDAVRDVVAATGALAGKSRRALDSTVLDDAVATQDTVTQLIASIRRVARTVPGGAELVTAAATVSGHDYRQTGKPQIAWDDTAAREALVDGLVGDANAVLAAIAARGDLPEGAAADAVGLLALVAGQDVEHVPDPNDPGAPGRWQIASRVAKDRVISTVDPDARHAHKTVSRRRDGFKAHVVVEPDSGLITGCALTKASGEGSGDAAAGLALLAADPTIEQVTPAPGAGTALEVLGDSAYGTGTMLAALAAAGHIPVIKPWPMHSLIPGGFTAADFTVDEAAGTVTCPAGQTAALTPLKRAAKFKARCADCPLRARCTTSAAGRTVVIAEHDALQRAHRARATDPGFQAVYRRHRPMAERTLAWLTRGNRRLRYRGVTKNDAWLHLRVAAINLRRLLNLGLTGTQGRWSLP